MRLSSLLLAWLLWLGCWALVGAMVGAGMGAGFGGFLARPSTFLGPIVAGALCGAGLALPLAGFVEILSAPMASKDPPRFTVRLAVLIESERVKRAAESARQWRS